MDLGGDFFVLLVCLGGGVVGWLFFFFLLDVQLVPEEAQGRNEVSLRFPTSWPVNNQSFSHAYLTFHRDVLNEHTDKTSSKVFPFQALSPRSH